MILDSEEQREFLQQAIGGIQVPGSQVEVVAALKRCLREADVEEPKGGCPVAEAVSELRQQQARQQGPR